jgi:outer membrane protein insertion porin family
LNVGAGYLWRESESKSHELFPVDVNYVRTDNKSQGFDELLDRNTFLSNSFQNQFIVGSRYSYTLNTQMRDDQVLEYEERKYKTHSFYFNGNVLVAGNTLSGFQKAFNRESGEIFGSPYSQFVRGDVDFRYYLQFNLRSKLASRIVVGSGYAYGNSTTMPYIKQFSIGGSNSIRAFPARSIGPGTFDIREQLDAPPSDDNAVPVFIDQRGDLKLESNVEYRFDIIKSFKGAVFVDAGNIWLWDTAATGSSDTRVGGAFNGKTFLKELAVGTGFGVRLDFSFFVLRLDLAFPIRKPFLPEDERWVFDRINLGSSEWRKENLIFNIAIGYPF